MKAEPKHILAGTVVIVILILLASYKFLYSPSIEKADAIENENKQLELRKTELNNKIANKSMYQEGINSSKKIIDAVFKKYGPGNTPEKTIMTIVSLCNMTGVSVESVTFADDAILYQSPTANEEDKAEYVLKRTTSTIDMKGGYLQLKKVFDFINSYCERMNVQSFSSEFDLEEGLVSSNIMLNLYSVEDENHKYVAPNPGEVAIGTPNIFRGLTIVDVLEGMEGEEGLEGQEGTTDNTGEANVTE